MKAQLLLEQQLRSLHQAIQYEHTPDNGLLRERGLPTEASRADLTTTLLPIYQNAYRARLAGALADNYSVLQRALGDHAFDQLAQAYIAAHPSHAASIRWFGHRLDPFMAGEGASHVPHPAFADLARMEWALRAAFDAPDAASLGLERLAALPAQAWPALRFSLHPATHLIALEWAVGPAWRILHEHDPATGKPEPEVPSPEPFSHHLLIWRQKLETRWRSLDTLEANALHSVREGKSFSVLCQEAAVYLPADQAASAIAQCLHQWIADGILSDALAVPAFDT